MVNRINYDKPSIIVYVTPVWEDESFLNEVFWGIEEEGVPFVLHKSNETDSLTLSYEASLQSRLETGIGLGIDGLITLHYSKLELNTPVFQVRFDDDNAKLRALGANAARLVKGKPFIIVK